MLGTIARMEKRVENLSELREEARRFISTLPNAKGKATLVTLSGELGAGKTAFVQAVGEALSVKERITSPTFVLLKTYLLPAPSAWKHLVHIDAYRLKDASELSPLLFSELQTDQDNLIVIEWPENIADALLHVDARITLTSDDSLGRRIVYE